MKTQFIAKTFSLLSVISLMHSRVYAATAWGDCVVQGAATIQCLVPLFKNVVVAVVELAGIALFLMFIIGGFQFIMSGGNPKQLEQAKGTLTYAIIGVVVIVTAYLMLKLISQFTGVDVTKFNISTN